jgi:hypothetical protein
MTCLVNKNQKLDFIQFSVTTHRSSLNAMWDARWSADPLITNIKKDMKKEANQTTKRVNLSLCRPLFLALAAGFMTSRCHAANFEVLADTPVSFRANFTGVDTDPASLGSGNDFKRITFDFWTVLVNLRGDSVDLNGNAFGFYEIQLIHSGNLIPNPDAPILDSFLVWGPLAPDVEDMDTQSHSKPNGAGFDYLSTTVNFEYDPDANVVNYSGTISGDSDLDGNGVLDSKQTDEVVKILQGLKDQGEITGSKMGEIIKQTNQTKPKTEP